MRVLLLAPHPFFQNRGTPIAERALLEVLASRGHQIDVLTYHEGENVPIPNCRIRRIPAPPGVHGLRPGFSFKKLVCDAFMLVEGLKVVREQRFDLVHAVEESAFIAVAIRRLFGVPYVYDMDSSLAQQMMEKYPWLTAVRRPMEATEAAAVKRSVAVVAVCRALEELVRGVDPSKPVGRVEDFSLLSGGPEDGERLRETIGRPGPIALYVGNLEAYQGIDLLLEGFVHTVRAVVEARLVIIGGSEADITAYRDRAGRLGIGDNVHFVGPRPVSHLGWYLRQAEVVLSPRTQGVNTPMKVYSYLDSGRPLLATRLPTHTQVLDDGIAMLAAPEPREFGDALARLLESAELRERLAGEARRRVEREFSRQAFRRKMAAFYDRVEREVGVAASGRAAR